MYFDRKSCLLGFSAMKKIAIKKGEKSCPEENLCILKHLDASKPINQRPVVVSKYQHLNKLFDPLTHRLICIII